MTTDLNPNPSNAPSTFPPRTSEVPTQPATTGSEAGDRLDRVADHLAHKGAKAEQDFDKDNSNLFSK